MSSKIKETEVLEHKLADAALAYRLVQNLAEKLDDPHARSRAELALLQIETLGAFLALVGRETECQRGVSQWQSVH